MNQCNLRVWNSYPENNVSDRSDLLTARRYHHFKQSSKSTIMRKALCLIAAALTLIGCDRSSTTGNNTGQQKHAQSKTEIVSDAQENQTGNSIDQRNIFTKSDAEKILGEPAHLTDSAWTIEGDSSVYRCSYTANSKDQKSGKTGAIYFMFEQHPHIASAKKVYSSIKTANENHGIRELNDLGDEAYFHTDRQNFYFILVRKGEKLIRMKVNKITSTTSLDEFNQVAGNITAAL